MKDIFISVTIEVCLSLDIRALFHWVLERGDYIEYINHQQITTMF